MMELLQGYTRAALAFSGGVDSAYLLYAAVKAGVQVRAYYVQTPFQPAFELADAQRLAKELGADMTVLEMDVLQDETVRKNPANRCYYCKKRIFTAITEAAKKDGFDIIMDGTNASDDVSDRPGFRALQELQVRSPLREAGLTKDRIRELSAEAGLFTHNKPAYACLATRIPAGVEITREALERTEWAEEYLKSKGFSDFRIRLDGKIAKIQVPEVQIPRILENRQEILSTLKTRYAGVVLDLEVRG